MVNAGLASLFRATMAHRKEVLLAFAAILAFIIYTAQVKAFIITMVLGLAATFSTFYKRVFQAPPAFELMTLTIVAVSVFYGRPIGALYALVVSLTAEIAAQALDPFSITYIFPRVMVALVSPWLVQNGIELALLGFLMSVLYNALQQPVYWLLTDPEKRIKSLYFSLLNIPLNFLIFKFLGGPLFAVLQRIA
ncbi:TPA: hypothetical protein HA231_03410 [Candidatus Woesearchaeota archaeon]|nr:hypothetical protein [Candidatus Woesearchaeota archaeon]